MRTTSARLVAPTCMVAAWLAAAGMAEAQTIVTTKLWEIPAGARNHVTTGTTERGIAINSKTGHVIIASRAGGLNLIVVDGTTGEDLAALDTTDIAGGTFAVNMIGVADDGAIYAANLVTAASDTSPFKIYRWANESAVPTVAYQGAPSAGMRFGDSLDVRGAGVSTEIAAGSSGTATTARFAVFTTTDGERFTSKAFAPTGVAAGVMQKGVAFGPTNSIYGVSNGQSVQHVRYDWAAGSASVIRSFSLAGNSISPIVVDPAQGILAAIGVVAPNTHRLFIYDISDPASPSLAQTLVFPEPITANGNGVGGIDMQGGKIAALETQNGILALSYVLDLTPVAPIVTSEPANQIALESGTVTFTASARGTKPLTYAWYFNETNLIAAATTASYTTTAALDKAGTYSVLIKNSVGEARSTNATLTVTPIVRSGRLAPAWQLAPGSRPYIATDNNQRGMSYNPATRNILLVSRSLGQTNIYVLDSTSGAEKHRLRSTDAEGTPVLSSGTFVLNMIGIADDGAVYACNLGDTTTGGGFKIYRWANDGPDTIPTLAYGPENPGLGGRVGDTLAVRGAGPATQILAGSRNNISVAIFTTVDGESFVPTVAAVTDAPAGSFGLGVAFGEGNTFYGKAAGATFPLRLVSFNLDNGEGTTLAAFNEPGFSGVTAINYDPTSKFLGGVSIENPDNLRLYGVTNSTEAPVLLHQEFFPTDNANGNLTGSVDFGDGFVFALDSNNGLIAYRIIDPATEPVVITYAVSTSKELTLTWRTGTLETASSVVGPWTKIPTPAPTYKTSLQATARAYYRVSVP